MSPTRGPVLLIIGLATTTACTSAPNEIDEVREAVTVCPTGDIVDGVDVSKYQGSIDFDQVRQAGYRFAIARTGDGNLSDEFFVENWAAMKTSGLYRGAYQFFRASEDPIVQADALLMAMGALGSGDLAPTLDVEVSDGQASSVVVAHATQWLEHVALATGRTPMIYTSSGFWSQIGNPDLSSYALWVANWQVTCPNTPAPWAHWSFWQSSDSGSVAGITGSVDIDHFNGSAVELAALAASPMTSTNDAGQPDAGPIPEAVDDGTIQDAALLREPTVDAGLSKDAPIAAGCSLRGGAVRGNPLTAAAVVILFLLVRRYSPRVHTASPRSRCRRPAS